MNVDQLDVQYTEEEHGVHFTTELAFRFHALVS